MKRISICLLFFLFGFPYQQGYSQQAYDTSYVNELNAKSRALIPKGEYLKADSFARQAQAVAEQIKFQKGIFYANTNLGVLYWYQ